MDFGNERYVRLYVRDTVTWKRLGWDGQNALTQLLRKADRSGVIDLGGIEPWETLVVLCGAPEDVARRGTARCLELACIVHDGDRLVFPRYLEAQEATQSGAQRVREHRARERELRAQLKQNVTAVRNETLPNANAVKRGETTGNSVPSRAVPCLTVPSESERAREEQSSDHWADGMFEQTLRTGFQRRYEQAVQSIPNQSQVAKMSATVAKWVAQTARLRNQPEDVIMRQLVDGFFASDSAREKGFPPSFLAANPLEYFEPRKKSGPDAKVQQSTLAKLEDELAQLKTRKRELDKSDPEYDVRLYEFNRDINAAQERRDSAKRKLDATG